MIPLQALDAADRLLRDLMETDEPFGGKVVVLGGDFRQVLPVLPHSARESIVSQTIPKHPLWLGEIGFGPAGVAMLRWWPLIWW